MAIFTLNNRILRKPDYSTLYATELHQFKHALATNDHKDAILTASKVACLISYITTLLSNKIIQPQELERQTLDLCTTWWSHQLPCYEDPFSEFYLGNVELKDVYGLPISVNETKESITEFGTCGIPEPPECCNTRLPQVLFKLETVSELQRYFDRLNTYCQLRMLPTDIQQNIPEFGSPKKNEFASEFLDEWLVAYKNSKNTPTPYALLLARNPELMYKDDIDNQTPKRKRVGRPAGKTEKVPKAKDPRYIEALDRYNDASKSLAAAKDAYTQACEYYNKCRNELRDIKAEIKK